MIVVAGVVVGDLRVRVRVVVDGVVFVLLGIHTSRGEATRAYRHNTRTIRIVQSSVLTITTECRPSPIVCLLHLQYHAWTSFGSG